MKHNERVAPREENEYFWLLYYIYNNFIFFEIYF